MKGGPQSSSSKPGHLKIKGGAINKYIRTTGANRDGQYPMHVCGVRDGQEGGAVQAEERKYQRP